MQTPLLLLTLLPVACQSSPREEALRQKVASLESELHRLETLEESVKDLEEDVRSLRRSRGRARLKEAPIFPGQYIPNDSFKDDPFLGPKDSDVLVMMFSNFSCKPCRKFYTETLPQLKKDFVESNRVKFVFRDLPLNGQDQGRKAAKFAHCVGEQGYYWEAFDLLYRSPEAVDKEDWKTLVSELKEVERKKLSRCLKSKRYDGELEADLKDGHELGAKGAPGFFVGKRMSDGSFSGSIIRGAQPYPVIKAQLMKLLG